MTDKDKTTQTAPKPEKDAVPAGHVRVKIWTDGVFSSLGPHAKGAIVDLPADDADILIKGEHAQKC